MGTGIDIPGRMKRTDRRPLWLSVLACYSILLGIIWLRRPWVIPVGLITGAMILNAIIGFFLGDIFAGLPSVTNDVSYWASNLPYLIYPLWLIPVLLCRRPLFVGKWS